MENSTQSPLTQQVQQLQTRYYSLPQRDRMMLNILAVFFAIVVLIYGVVIPASEYSAEADKVYQKNLADLQWLKSKVPEIRASKSGRQTKSAAGKSMLSIAASTSKKQKIVFKRTEPEGENGLRIWLENVSFNDTILWLDTLNSQYGFGVKQVNIDRQDIPGTANMKLVLYR